MKNTRQGFTITEVMLAAAISTVIIFGVFGILQVSNRQLQNIHARMSLQEGPREAMFKMAQEIRQTAWHKIAGLGTAGADGVESSSTINFVVPVPSPNSSSLVDANLTPKWAHNIQYLLDGTNHRILRIATNLTTLATQQSILANEIRGIEFSRETSVPGLITIRIAAQRELPDGQRIPEEPIWMTTKAEARNP